MYSILRSYSASNSQGSPILQGTERYLELLIRCQSFTQNQQHGRYNSQLVWKGSGCKQMYVSSAQSVSRKKACDQYFLQRILMLLKLVPLPFDQANTKIHFLTATKKKKKKKTHATSIILPSQCLAYMEMVPIYFHY